MPAGSVSSIAGYQTRAPPGLQHFPFSHQHPVLKRILAGDTVITKTVDSGGKDEKGVERSPGGNPLTGPFYIEGVEEGDAIAVRFHKVRLNRNWGTSSNRLGCIH